MGEIWVREMSQNLGTLKNRYGRTQEPQNPPVFGIFGSEFGGKLTQGGPQNTPNPKPSPQRPPFPPRPSRRHPPPPDPPAAPKAAQPHPRCPPFPPGAAGGRRSGGRRRMAADSGGGLTHPGHRHLGERRQRAGRGRKARKGQRGRGDSATVSRGAGERRTAARLPWKPGGDLKGRWRSLKAAIPGWGPLWDKPPPQNSGSPQKSRTPPKSPRHPKNPSNTTKRDGKVQNE